MATETLVDKKSEEEEVKDKENEEGSKEEVTAKLLEFLESPQGKKRKATPSKNIGSAEASDTSTKNVKTFKDVKGCDDARQELEKVVEYLKNPSKFTRLGGSRQWFVHGGILLTGAPGTGKTLLAKDKEGVWLIAGDIPWQKTK
ncbi:hypothetical protein GOBAR_AA06252 [Gossypium barbadense]|uniref:ATPase AAA-type core domain-containing protein n=1 Tax=Gossypium barbadense TaxID=3634 RepID=A0A2P5YFF6_GOSBA|nr:hypothetical protein GOBAR_AA06252 [Gossypium barbadense]